MITINPIVKAPLKILKESPSALSVNCPQWHLSTQMTIYLQSDNVIFLKINILQRDKSGESSGTVPRYFTSFCLCYGALPGRKIHQFSFHKWGLFLHKISLKCCITPQYFSLLNVEPKGMFFSPISLTLMTFSSIEIFNDFWTLCRLHNYTTHELVDSIDFLNLFSMIRPKKFHSKYNI